MDRLGRSGARRARLLGVYLLYLLLLGELAARTYLAVTLHTSFWRPAEAIEHFYPELGEVRRASISRTDDAYDVLVLGASVMVLGDIQELLQKGLEKKLQRTVRIHNVSVRAHTTRDSFLKYVRLADKRFDLVIVYDAVNEVRANNCPPELFREDYSHYAWYARVNALGEGTNLLALPSAARLAWVSLRDALGRSVYVPAHFPKTEWLDYGAQIKTVPAFAANLGRIVAMAAERGDPLVLMTFAHYLPPNYNLLSFREGKLDYAAHLFPTELWGRPENVVRGIEEHNQVIRTLHAEHPETLFVDQEALIPKDGRHFDDICHLAEKGRKRWVADLLAALP